MAKRSRTGASKDEKQSASTYRTARSQVRSPAAGLSVNTKQGGLVGGAINASVPLRGLEYSPGRRGKMVTGASVSSGTIQLMPAGSLSSVNRIRELLELDDPSTTNTSMRIPTALRDAAAIAVRELGVAESTTALTANALRTMLEAVTMQAVLDAHYAEHPGTRPTLARLAVAAARIDGHPLAEHPDVLRQAAEQIIKYHADADADDVLLWAEAQQQSITR